MSFTQRRPRLLSCGCRCIAGSTDWNPGWRQRVEAAEAIASRLDAARAAARAAEVATTPREMWSR